MQIVKKVQKDGEYLLNIKGKTIKVLLLIFLFEGEGYTICNSLPKIILNFHHLYVIGLLLRHVAGKSHRIFNIVQRGSR